MMRRASFVLILVVVLILAVGCSPASEVPDESEATSTGEATAVAMAIAPDFVALVGECAMTAQNTEASGGAIHYGDAALMDEYQAKAQELGIDIEFVALSEDDETFMHGMAGWPVGQEPGPGMQIDSGAAVRLVVIEAGSAQTTPDSDTPASDPSAIYTPQKGDPTRNALMDAARALYGGQSLYVVSELYVLGDWAVGIMVPEDQNRSSSYSDVYAWHRTGGAWECVLATGDVGETDDPAGDIRSAVRDAYGVPAELAAALRFN